MVTVKEIEIRETLTKIKQIESEVSEGLSGSQQKVLNSKLITTQDMLKSLQDEKQS